jgi:hypothetical protein
MARADLHIPQAIASRSAGVFLFKMAAIAGSTTSMVGIICRVP